MDASARSIILHLISDEIFALSTYITFDVLHPSPFVSALSIDFKTEAGCNPGLVHVMYGISKDINANGHRIGVLVSQHNPDLLTAMRSTVLFMKVAPQSDILWSKILNDSTYLLTFQSKNKELLSEAYRFVTGWLKFHDIPSIPSNADHYLMVNFRPFFSSHDFEGNALPTDDNGAAKDRHFVAVLLKHKPVGAAWCWPEPGWFRFTFATRRNEFVVGLS